MSESLAAAARAMGGTLHGNDSAFGGISTDSRSLDAGNLYFALQGPNFDGHDFVTAVCRDGAAGAVVSRLVEDDIAQIKVDDTRLALGRYGAACRAGKSIRVVGITGSNGKTTLKQLVAACVSTERSTIATLGNLNNDIGMPLMLARIRDEHEVAVLEMGANHAGEIAYLAGLAQAEVVVITNAAAAHLEGFGSIEGVARAKGEILETVKRPRVAVLNADDDYYEYWCSLVSDIDTVTFGLERGAGNAPDVFADQIVSSASGSQFTLHIDDETVAVEMPLPGLHNVRNACAAAAVARAIGISLTSVKQGLENATNVAGRLQAMRGINDCMLFDDSYNANPLSVIAAAEFLASLDGESWLVLGDMKELGADAEQMHTDVGAAARDLGIDRLFTFGELARHAATEFGAGAASFIDIDDLVASLTGVDDRVNVLVKGSRSMRMERVVQALSAPAPVRREA